MKCPNCGKEIADDSLFCECCGAQITKQKNNKPLLIILAVITLFALAGAFFGYVTNQKEKQQILMSEKEQSIAQAGNGNQNKDFNQPQRNSSEDSKRKEQQDYVDLGLPSGTKWKKSSEKGNYSYDQAIKKFGKKLPTKEQAQELSSLCNWKKEGEDISVIGPNGNSIKLRPIYQKREDGKNCFDVTLWTYTPSDNIHILSFCVFDTGDQVIGLLGIGETSSEKFSVCLVH